MSACFDRCLWKDIQLLFFFFLCAICLQRAEAALWERERVDYAVTQKTLQEQSNDTVSVNESVNMSTDLTPALNNLQLKV